MFQIAVEIKAQYSGTWEYYGRVGQNTFRAMEKDAVEFDTLRQSQLQAHYLRSRYPEYKFIVVDNIANTMPDGEQNW